LLIKLDLILFFKQKNKNSLQEAKLEKNQKKKRTQLDDEI